MAQFRRPQVQAAEPGKVSQAWHTPATLVLGKQGQEDPGVSHTPAPGLVRDSISKLS